MNYILDGSTLITMDDVHDALSRALNFPSWYGRNLDALFDMLTENEGTITVKNTALLLNALKLKSVGLLKTLLLAEQENPHLKIFFE